MKKNGFTLVELIAVIVVLAVILGIVATNVFNIYEDAKQTEYNTQMEMMKESAKSYVADNKRSIFSSSNKTCVSIRTLVVDNYLENIPINSKENKQFSDESGFLITKNENIFTYEFIDNVYTSDVCNN